MKKAFGAGTQEDAHLYDRTALRSADARFTHSGMAKNNAFFEAHDLCLAYETRDRDLFITTHYAYEWTF